MTKKTQYWFKRRRYGWGWAPVTHEGYASLIAFIVVTVGAALYVLPSKDEVPTSLQMVTFLLILLSAIFLMIGVSYAKGPSPRWRWGSTQNDNPDEDI